METQRSRGSGIASDECSGWGIGVCSSSGACGVVFGNDFGDRGVEIDKKIVFEVARDSGELCIVVLG